MDNQVVEETSRSRTLIPPEVYQNALSPVSKYEKPEDAQKNKKVFKNHVSVDGRYKIIPMLPPKPERECLILWKKEWYQTPIKRKQTTSLRYAYPEYIGFPQWDRMTPIIEKAEEKQSPNDSSKPVANSEGQGDDGDDRDSDGSRRASGAKKRKINIPPYNHDIPDDKCWIYWNKYFYYSDIDYRKVEGIEIEDGEDEHLPQQGPLKYYPNGEPPAPPTRPIRPDVLYSINV